MQKTEESLRRLKKGKKSAFSLFGGSTAKEDDGRADEEKIRVQMVLDVAAFGKDAESLGVAVQRSETFIVLEEMAGASFTDGTLPSSLPPNNGSWVVISCRTMSRSERVNYQ